MVYRLIVNHLLLSNECGCDPGLDLVMVHFVGTGRRHVTRFPLVLAADSHFILVLGSEWLDSVVAEGRGVRVSRRVKEFAASLGRAMNFCDWGTLFRQRIFWLVVGWMRVRVRLPLVLAAHCHLLGRMTERLLWLVETGVRCHFSLLFIS